MNLPSDLLAALDRELQATDQNAVAEAARRMSQRYRERDPGTGFAGAGVDARAYAAHRMPATYAAVRAVLREVATRQPEPAPRTLLDVGAGPGTGIWAAAATWPGLVRAAALERDRAMIAVGRALAAGATHRVVREAEWLHGDIAGTPAWPVVGVSVAAYTLGELHPDRLPAVVDRMWQATEQTCVIVEPGTPAGYRTIGAAGDVLAGAGATIIAPFPHSWQCTESDGDWCHFAERVPRTGFLRRAKGGVLAYEDEKYAYVAASRRSALPIAARVIRHPQVRSGHVRLVLCTAQGVRHLVVARSDGASFRRARSLVWGSAVECDEADLFGLPQCEQGR